MERVVDFFNSTSPKTSPPPPKKPAPATSAPATPASTAPTSNNFGSRNLKCYDTVQEQGMAAVKDQLTTATQAKDVPAE